VQGRDLVVESLAALVEAPPALAGQLPEHRLVNDARGRDVGGQFQQAEQAAGVAVGHGGQRGPQLRREAEIESAKTALGVRQRPLDQAEHVRLGQRAQHVDPRP
jgi:hypothetical protein